MKKFIEHWKQKSLFEKIVFINMVISVTIVFILLLFSFLKVFKIKYMLTISLLILAIYNILDGILVFTKNKKLFGLVCNIILGLIFIVLSINIYLYGFTK